MAYVDDLLARDERIVYQAHRHVIYLVIRIGLYALAALLLWTAAGVVAAMVDGAGGIIATVLVVASLAPVAIAIWRTLLWQKEQYIVTNFRIIQVEGVLQKRTFDTALEKVNDVLMTQTVPGRIFGYGNIKILTGADAGINDLTAIADPHAFKRVIVETKMELGGDGLGRRAEVVSAVVDDRTRLLAALAELRDSGMITPEEYDERKAQLVQRSSQPS